MENPYSAVLNFSRLQGGFRFVDVYGKTQWHSGGIRASASASEDKPVVIAHEDVSAVLVEQEEQRGGWTRYRYLITPNLKTQKSSGTGAFEQRVIKFAQPFTGITKENCVSYDSVTSTAGIVQSRMPHPQCPVSLDAVHVGVPSLPTDTPANSVNFAIVKYDAVHLMQVSSASHQVKLQALTDVMLQTGQIRIAKYLTMLQMV